MDPAIASLLTIAGSDIAAYYGAYLKKRGEDQAMQFSLSAISRTTNAILAALSEVEKVCHLAFYYLKSRINAAYEQNIFDAS
jgi:hypothetical protein